MNLRTIVLSSALLLFVAASSYESSASAESQQTFWQMMCASCHDGKTAAGKDTLRDKYKTTAAFTDAVLSRGDRCMNILKNDRKLIRKIGKEIGLQDPE